MGVAGRYNKTAKSGEGPTLFRIHELAGRNL